MPIYRYVPVTPPCKLCGDGFEQRQAADASPLTHCPTCGQAVQRITATANLPKLTAPKSVSQLKQAGFTVLRRTCDGSFEKS